ncbi:MAG: hypothetical protein E7606_00335 [Ruminococcaceae bacterium]|nr:hypothetical protein [Oscillospiraceae bacterium]
MNNVLKDFKQKTSNMGLRVFLITLAVLIGLTALNFLFSLLPTSVTELDASADKIYSVTSTAKRSLAKLKQDVEIYYLAAGGERSLVDERLQTKIFLDKLPSYSSHVSVKVIDTATDANFVSSLGIGESYENYSIVVKSDKRARVLTQSDLFYYSITELEGLIGKLTAAEAQQYVYMLQAYYGQTVTPTYHFDGEGQLLSAIDYVTSDDLSRVYILGGHSETELSTALTDKLELQYMATASLTLQGATAIPEDCALLVIHCPQSDLTAEEAQSISAYLDKGGKLMLVTLPGISELTNLLSVTNAYGLYAEDGIVIETDNQHYYQYPFYLVPNIASHAITKDLATTTPALLFESHGIRVAESLPSGVGATALFTTSDGAYIIETNAESMNRPEGQTPSAHHVGVVAEAENGAEIVWISSYGITNENANTSAQGGNYSYFLAALQWLCKAEAPVSLVPSITLSLSHLDVPTATAGFWAIVLILLVPIAIFAAGLVYWLRRRRK